MLEESLRGRIAKAEAAIAAASDESAAMAGKRDVAQKAVEAAKKAYADERQELSVGEAVCVALEREFARRELAMEANRANAAMGVEIFKGLVQGGLVFSTGADASVTRLDQA